MQGLKSQRPVEPDRAWHLVGGQCDSADSLDHGLNLLFHFSAPPTSTLPVRPFNDNGRTWRQINLDLGGSGLRISTLPQGVASEARSC